MDSSGLVIVISGTLVALGSVIAIIKKDLIKCSTPCITCQMRQPETPPRGESNQPNGPLTTRINQNVRDIEDNVIRVQSIKKNIEVNNKPEIRRKNSYP